MRNRDALLLGQQQHQQVGNHQQKLPVEVFAHEAWLLSGILWE